MSGMNNKTTIKYEPVETVLKRYMDELGDTTVDFEEINVEESLSRILYDDIVAQFDLPTFNRSLVDGYAVNSRGIALADTDSPVILEVMGESQAGIPTQLAITKNQAVKISTGSLLPENADSVVLAECAQLEDNKVKIFKSVLMGENIVQKGEDINAGQMFIRKKRKIRPQDIGGIIGLGYKKIRVYKKPVISVIPTGSELVSIDETPEPGQLIETNSHVLKGLIKQLGGTSIIKPIIKDSLDLLKKSIIDSLKDSDVVIISGGSAFGTKDYTLNAIQSIPNSKIIAHGTAMRPAKHTLLAFIDGKPVIGLPGHPVSSGTSFHTFVKPILIQLAGNPRSFWQERKDNVKLDAILAKDVESPKGVEDYIRVRLVLLDNGKITAYPYAGKSSFLSTLVKAHGTIKLTPDCTKLYAGDRVQVTLF
ncbi:MAG: hypothetical protein ACD_20C00301G0006 [uncultured bacterium]|nr:MAG: hypothetical protein ACD_20C00301G0006 [uncultured bacterium]